MTPQQRSRKLLQGAGWHVETVEHYSFFTKRRHDLFGFADLLAIHPDEGRPLLIQVTTSSNMSARRKKILDSSIVDLVLATFDVEIHGWVSRAPANGLKRRKWVARRWRLIPVGDGSVVTREIAG